MAIMSGPSSLHMDSPTIRPSTPDKPRSTKVGPVSSANTPPMNSDKMQTISKLALPMLMLPSARSISAIGAGMVSSTLRTRSTVFFAPSFCITLAR